MITTEGRLAPGWLCNARAGGSRRASILFRILFNVPFFFYPSAGLRAGSFSVAPASSDNYSLISNRRFQGAKYGQTPNSIRNLYLDTPPGMGADPGPVAKSGSMGLRLTVALRSFLSGFPSRSGRAVPGRMDHHHRAEPAHQAG